MYDLVKRVIKAQNEDLICRIAERFGLDKDAMLSKYARPTFYLPDVTVKPVAITYTTKTKKSSTIY
jgi:hypothetical protein